MLSVMYISQFLHLYLTICGTVITPVGPVIGGTYDGGCSGTVTYTWTYTDGGGNNHDWIYTFTIQDTQAPVITTTATNGNLGCNPTITEPVFTGTDNCEGTIIPAVTTEGPQNDGCVYTQTWSANYTDACGNAAQKP